MLKKLSISLLIVSASLCGANAQQQNISIMPRPVSMTVQEGIFTLKDGMKIGVSDKALLPAAQYLQLILKEGAKTTTGVGNGVITLKLDPSLRQEGAYELQVSPKGVQVKATDYAGVVAAIASIRQLLPLEGKVLSLPAVTIKDDPRFAWRGIMMDASRHFWTKQEVEGVLDMMALYKLNKFHWHLTDDQGWRVEIKKYPLLTEKGAWRKFNSHDRECMRRAKTEDNTDFLIPEDKLKVVNGDTLYGGYYTQQDIKDIVAYAAQRGIEVIPEVDMPGHFLAAINPYPDIACTGAVGWGHTFSSPICPGKDSSMEFCKNVYKEIFQLFPSKYVHLGGDEVEKTNWKKCEDCQKRMKDESLDSEEALQAWFVKDMEKFFTANSKKLIGWDEVVADGLSKDATIMWWRSWYPKAVPTATAEGKHAIATPNEYFYFDYQQDRNTIKKLLGYDPALMKLTPEQQKLIMGVQGNVWAEWIPTMKRWQFMVVPRLLALSEVAWSEPDAKLNEKAFYEAAISQFKRLDKMEVNYRIPDLEGFYSVNAFVDKTELRISCPLPEVEIRYTTNGTIPTRNSNLYLGPVAITESTDFILRTFRPDGTSSDFVKTSFVKAPYAEADAEAEPEAAGLLATWYGYKGNHCAEIDSAARMDDYVVESVSIPDGVKGNIGLVLKGYLQIPADGIYTFALLSDDGSTFKIGDELVIDNDGAHSSREITAQKALRKGLHPVEIRYFDSNGGTLSMYVVGEDGQKKVMTKEWWKH